MATGLFADRAGLQRPEFQGEIRTELEARAAPESKAVRDEARLRLELVAAGVLGIALSIGAGAITAAGEAGEGTGLAVVARASVVAVPVAVGLYAWRRRPAEHFGRLLVLLGMGWSLTTLAESSDELLYSIGRVAGWLAEVGLAWLVLAFPAGELRSRVDHALVWAAVALVATLYLPTVLVAKGYPAPSLWGSCETDCAGNAFLVGGSQPAVVDSVLLPVREVLSVLLILAVTARLTQRVRLASRLMRQTLAPTLVVASARLLAEAIGLGVRRADPDSPVVDLFIWAVALGVPAFAAAFFLGLIRRRLYVADALQRLAVRVKGHLSRDELRLALSEAVDDPSLQLVYWVNGDGDHWVDANGRPLQPPGSESRRCLSEVRDREQRVAGIVHDAALEDQRGFVQAVGSYAILARENHLLRRSNPRCAKGAHRGPGSLPRPTARGGG